MPKITKEEILRQLKETGVIVLDAKDNYRDEEGFKILRTTNFSEEGASLFWTLVRVLRTTNLSLKGLSLKGTSYFLRIDDTSMRSLVEVLLRHKKTLTTLILSCHNISDEGVRALAHLIENSLTLTMLDLSYNHISDKGVIELAKALLKHKKTLTALNLSGNDITDEGATALVPLLENNQTLTMLNLCGNYIEYVVGILAEVLEQNRTLTTLKLDSKRLIDASGVRELADVLRKINTLRELYLGCCFSRDREEDGKAALKELLETNLTLTILDLRIKDLCIEDAEFIADILRTNFTLTTFSLNWQNIWKTPNASVCKARVVEVQQRIEDYLERNRQLKLAKTFMLGTHPRLGEKSPLKMLADLHPLFLLGCFGLEEEDRLEFIKKMQDRQRAAATAPVAVTCAAASASAAAPKHSLSPMSSVWQFFKLHSSFKGAVAPTHPTAANAVSSSSSSSSATSAAAATALTPTTSQPLSLSPPPQPSSPPPCFFGLHF